MNGASYDFMGDVLRKQMDISYELDVQVQISYDAVMLSGTTLFSQFQTGFSYSAGGEVDIARLGTTGNDTLDHSNRTDGSADLLFGLGGEDVLRGGAGGDYLWGGADDDELYGGDDSDLLSGDGGSDILDGGGGTDVVSYELATQAVTITLIGGTPGGGASGDTISNVEGVIGSAFADTISLAGQTAEGFIEGRAGDDVLTGGDGMDFIFGEAGNDTLNGGQGGDTMAGREGDDSVNGDAGDDVLEGNVGTDALNGGAGADHLYGGDGDDTVDGGDDADHLSGGDGDDILIVNSDHWNLDGGDGDDSYWFTNTTAVTLDTTLEYWVESDPNGAMKYNGSLIGTDIVHLENGTEIGVNYLDSIGTGYNGGQGYLWIWLPTNEAIYVNGWSNGDMGIFLPGL